MKADIVFQQNAQDYGSLRGGRRYARNMGGTNRTGGSMPVWQPKSLKANFAEGRKIDTSDLLHNQPREKEYADVTFNDFVDIVNPLQHLPLVSSVYRHVTGDEIKPPARVMGGALYGGPIGAAASMANVIVEDQTGKDIGENIMGKVTGEADVAPQRMTKRATNYAKADALDIVWNDTNKLAQAPNIGSRITPPAPAKPLEETQLAMRPSRKPTRFFTNDHAVDPDRKMAKAVDKAISGEPDFAAENARAFAGYKSILSRRSGAHSRSRTGGSMPVWQPSSAPSKVHQASTPLGNITKATKSVRASDLDFLPPRQPITHVRFSQS